MLKHARLCAALAFLCLPLSLHAQSVPQATGPQPTLTPLAAQQKAEGSPEAKAVSAEKDRDTIARVEGYLNRVKTLKADFMQTLSDGSTTTGKFSLKRPGKMRLEYAPPNRDLLVADGLFVHAYDSRARTSSSVPLGRSLADIILRDPFRLSGDLAVTEVRYFPGMLEVDVVQTSEPAAGKITLEFQDNPLALRNWRVVDAQGLMTRVSLSNEQMNVDVPGSTFMFDPQKRGRR